jgi:hypothetical protein
MTAPDAQARERAAQDEPELQLTMEVGHEHD